MRPATWQQVPPSIQFEVQSIYEALIESVVDTGDEPYPGKLTKEDQERAKLLFVWRALPDAQKLAMAQRVYEIRRHAATEIFDRVTGALGLVARVIERPPPTPGPMVEATILEPPCGGF